VRPVPATAEALEQLAALGETGLRDELGRIGRAGQDQVPGCLAVSLAVVDHALTFTLTADDLGPQAEVRSTLLLPVLRHGRVIAAVTFYASAPHAFERRVDGLAHAVGAWGPGAVRDADLSFSTRSEAAEAPARLRARVELGEARHVLACTRGISPEAAGAELREAAARVGIDETQVASIVLGVLEP
jgi:hypothetical protein